MTRDLPFKTSFIRLQFDTTSRGWCGRIGTRRGTRSYGCTLLCPDDIVCIFKLVLQLRVALESAVAAPQTAAAPPQHPVPRGIPGRARHVERALALARRTVHDNPQHTHYAASLRSVSRQRFCLLYCLRNPLYLTRSTIGTDAVTTIAPSHTRPADPGAKS